MKGGGAFAGFRPKGVSCGIGVGVGLANCVLVVLKRISRFTMPTGGTMSERNPGIVGNCAWLGKGVELTACPATLTIIRIVLLPPKVTGYSPAVLGARTSKSTR